jgi:hypothetical protein
VTLLLKVRGRVNRNSPCTITIDFAALAICTGGRTAAIEAEAGAASVFDAEGVVMLLLQPIARTHSTPTDQWLPRMLILPFAETLSSTNRESELSCGTTADRMSPIVRWDARQK